MSDENTSIGPPPRRPAPRQVAPPKVRTGVTVPPGGGLRPVSEEEDLAIGTIMPAVVVPPPMPRSRSGDSGLRPLERPTALTRAGGSAPGTFGGEASTPTSIDGAPGSDHEDRDPVVASLDTGDAPHLRREPGTGGAGARRPVPAVVLFLVPALLVALGGSGLLLASTPEPAENAAEPVASAETKPGTPVERELLWVAEVNEVDPARVLPFAERHERLDRLAPLPEAAFVDRRLNLVFDLVQAGDAPDPCGTFAAALDVVAADPDPSLGSALATVRAPSGDAPACAGLEARRQALLAAMTSPPQPEPPPEPQPEPQPQPDAESTTASQAEPAAVKAPPRSQPRPKGSRRHGKADDEPKAAADPEPEPAAPSRLDEELRPFGQ